MKKHYPKGYRQPEGIPAPAPLVQSLKASPECAKALELLPGIFDEVAPLTQNHRQELGRTIRSLWEDLTSEREHRTSEYLSSPAYYSAYVRYFLPWNIVRLSSIFPGLPLALEEGATIVDIGSGPLTVPIALYVSRPDLRNRRLIIYCTDKTERILKVGQAIFESLCVRLSGALPPWKIVLLRQQFGSHLPEKADLLTAANVFNEFFWKSKAPLGMRAILTARQLLGYLKDSGSVFLMEPGDPRSASFISSVRAALASFGAHPAAPCPHAKACPMPGIFRSLETPGGDSLSEPQAKALDEVVMPKRRDKYPWCHFTIGAEAAPAWLKALSGEAGLSKGKLVFSYLLSTIPEANRQAAAPSGEPALIRIVSEEFPLPGQGAGRYACSAQGYCLVRYWPLRFTLSSGDLLRAPHAPSGRAQFAGARQSSGAQNEREKRGSGGGKTHFAATLERRGGRPETPGIPTKASPRMSPKTSSKGLRGTSSKGLPTARNEAGDIDEKSGAVVVSY